MAVHFEAIAHCYASRADQRAAADAAGIGPDRMPIPADGDTLTLTR